MADKNKRAIWVIHSNEKNCEGWSNYSRSFNVLAVDFDEAVSKMREAKPGIISTQCCKDRTADYE